MATVHVTRHANDHRLFLKLAIAMALVIVLGFSTQLAMGRSSFSAPVMVHVHAVAFFGWTVLFVVQTALVGSEARQLHRRLGWVGAGWAAAVVAIGLYTTVMMVRRGGAPFFFTPAYFLFMNSLFVLGFGGLTAAAIVQRRNTSWHRRLMICGMAILTGPAFGRLLPLPLMIPWAGWGVFVAVMLFPLAGMIGDLRRVGRIHPAWWWGAGTIAVIQAAVGPIAASPPGIALYDRVVAGGRGETVAPLAYPPFPPM
ncbi:hypothetical protein GGR88_002801 [Sphingomonas jejuensis]|uniref:Uncharacterized protein n=1 Tax=Sphingomonas jejuensis TaxID=904715 RepID=A0ABX0XR47_9SPHN|nr:hypothetical protein [Sphingomonas jejuensis]NJC35287.1 hypothetical protein [Sphingomonas jejuensis]